MEKHILQMNAIEGQLKPETDIEHKLINHPDFMKGLFWGQPRYGHPEGKIIYHIAEVLKNIDQLNINLHTRQQLRLIAFLHDTFKYLEDTKSHTNAKCQVNTHTTPSLCGRNPHSNKRENKCCKRKCPALVFNHNVSIDITGAFSLLVCYKVV
mgnify:CR=1 FL=1